MYTHVCVRANNENTTIANVIRLPSAYEHTV
jgi:hypothetical protein